MLKMSRIKKILIYKHLMNTDLGVGYKLLSMINEVLAHRALIIYLTELHGIASI